jgi:steroid delta-isomerase-like uncharacterized protein
MNTEVNNQLVRRFEQQAWTRHNPAILDELCAPDYVAHMPGSRSLDHAAHRQLIALFQRAFPDCEVTTDELVAEGDRVASRWTFQGTHDGEFHGLPPTGKRVVMSGISMLKILDGRVLESWHQGDNQNLMQQLAGPQAA